MTTDLSERGLERLICQALTGDFCDPPAGPTIGEPAAPGGCGWSPGNRHDYDREHCIDIVQFRTFLHATQPKVSPALRLEEDGPTRRKFLARLHGEIAKHGVVAVLRDGIRHGAHDIDLFYGAPLPPQQHGPAAVCPEPVHRHPPTPLQPGERPAGAGYGPVHQRVARLHPGTQEQLHPADGGGRR